MFAGASEYLPSADMWLLHIYCIVFPNNRLICIEETNSLAQITSNVVEAKTVNSFQRRLDKLWTDQPV